MPHSESERFSPLFLARTVGILGLVGIVTGAFDIGYVQSTLIVNGNPAATLHNIAAHETLFRLGFASHLFEMLPNILGEIIGFILFRRVNALVAAFSLFCGFVGIGIEVIDLLIAYVPMQLAIGGNSLGAFSVEQLRVMSELSTQLQQSGLLLSFVFYGLDEFASGYLVYRSRFLPRFLGILVGLSGLCYFMHGFMNFLAPSLTSRLFQYIQFASLPGELGSSLWLTIMGLNVAKWRAWAIEPRPIETIERASSRAPWGWISRRDSGASALASHLRPNRRTPSDANC
jgi:hypothetical protein